MRFLHSYFFHTGTKLESRYVDISCLGRTLVSNICKVIAGYHALSGCNTTSVFLSQDKAASFKLLKTWYFSGCDKWCRGLLRRKRWYNDCLWGCNLNAIMVNLNRKLRCVMFGCESTDPFKLSPCQNAALYHIRLANYQAAIWRRCLIGHPQIPLSKGYGWTVSEDDINILWIDVLPAPASLLNLIKRNCKKQCSTDQCSCHKNLLKCISVGTMQFNARIQRHQ